MVTTFHWEFSYLTEVFCGTSKDTRRPPAELLALAFPQAMSGTTWRGKKKHHKEDRLLGLIMGQDHIRKQNPTGRLHSILWMMLGIVTGEAK